MKKLMILALLVITVAMAGCFNQEKEKSEEKEIVAEKAGTKSQSEGVSSYAKIYFESKILKVGIGQGEEISATKDSKLKITKVWTYNPEEDPAYYYYYDVKPPYSESEAEELYFGDIKKGKEYYISYNSAGWLYVTEVGTVNIINEKNQLFKTTLSNNGKWHAEGVRGEYFKVVNNDAEYTIDSNNGVDYGLSLWSNENIKFDSNKSYAVDITPDFIFADIKEEAVEEYTVICGLEGLDIDGYDNFYSGMKVEIISEDKKVITTGVIWDSKSNGYYIEVYNMKPGTYLFKSTYQREHWEYYRLLVEYSINSSVKISKDSGVVFYDETLITSVAVNKKEIKNLSKSFNSFAICGDFNKWNVKGNMNFIGNNLWEGEIETSALNTKVLFVSDERWGNNYGDSNKDGTAENGNGYINLQFAGKYLILFNDATMQYEIKLAKKTDLGKNFNAVAVCGEFNKWNVKGNMNFKGLNCWEGDIETTALDSKIIFVMNNSWGQNYLDSNSDGKLEKEIGYYINLQYAGKYHITFNDITMQYSIKLIKKTDIGKNFNEIAVSGTFNGWSPKGNMTFLGAHQWQYKIDIKTDSSMVFVMNNSWGQNYGDKNRDGILEKGNNYITVKKGLYQILFNDETMKYSLNKLN